MRAQGDFARLGEQAGFQALGTIRHDKLHVVAKGAKAPFKTSGALGKMAVYLVHDGVGALDRIADIDAHDSFPGKTLFEFDADIFGQNDHIGNGNLLRRQFVFNADRTLRFNL